VLEIDALVKDIGVVLMQGRKPLTYLSKAFSLKIKVSQPIKNNF
jgi:hypothetical protein